MWIKNDKGIWVSDKKSLLSPMASQKKAEEPVEITIKGTPSALKEFLEAFRK